MINKLKLSEQIYSHKADISSSDLHKLGFPEKEASVYLALLELGPSYPSKIAKEAHLNRVTCYDVLNSLLKKQLIVRVRRNNKLIFQIINIDALEDNLKKKQSEINTQFSYFRSLVPLLTELLNVSKEQPRVIYYEGRTGLEKFFKDNLTFPEYEVFGYTNLQRFYEVLDHKFLKEAIRQKVEYKIKSKYLVPYGHEPYIRKWTKLLYPQSAPENYISSFRPVSDQKITFDNHIKMYANRVAIFDLRDASSAQGIIIENKRIADTARNIFKLAWKGATK